ncbi:MAG: UDP-N-acetylmuramoyl-L-alanyl-D-glutamate--2,6-diaminopimelate ligase [Candidatus Omnitrophica bacterium]|nr:UDP-N-acetylmuramoyl-L-alanyl-D-glutamate--2,6-diaminopimelate ligase [Candidatus Omnitrophota bacterium]
MLMRIKELEYTGISDDSRTIKKGDIFFAIIGSKLDGHKFIQEAVRKGASAVVTDKDFKGEVNGIKIIRVSNPRITLGEFARDFYNRPSDRLKVIGITGTNGKTTVSYLLAEVLKKAGHQTGIIGTICHRWNDKIVKANNTTPGIIELQRLLNTMTEDSVEYCVMEVSSHSLDQDRVFGIDFNSAIFTNITSEHLDYHKQFSDYLAAKTKLFRMLKPARSAILNLDDENFDIIRRCTHAKIITYGVKKEADVRAEKIRIGLEKTEFLVKTKKVSFWVTTPLIGIFNVYNILAAISYALNEGMPLEIIKEAISNFKGAEGRLELVASGGDFKVFIDYAHTDNALENVLTALRGITKNRLILVFGCGGDRDTLKRPRMGKVASRLSDYFFITSDNPRSEDPLTIAKEIEKGIDKHFKNYKIILERFEAIREAVNIARKGDIILIAGKGHEKYQIIGAKTIPFSDREVAEQILSKKGLMTKCLA